MPAKGDAILIPSGASGQHLFVVLNDPKRFEGYGNVDHCVLVNFSSIDQDIPHDTTCVFQPGQHPFLISPSYVYYRGVRLDSAAHLDRCIQSGGFILRPPPFSAGQVEVVKQGLYNSPRVSRAFKGLVI